ncbi:MAG: hypothetical protein IPL49_21145 [Saprospirales bacterium]|nr:hypothetical protein [Saprospirales bacterium]
MSGNSDWKSTYANTNLSARICFSDQDFSGADLSIRPLDKGNIVFFNFHIFHMHRGVWMNTIPRFAEKHLIVRTYVANSEENWRDCIQANASAIATDKINDHSWCKVSNEHPYRVKVPNYDKRLIKNKANNSYRTDRATIMQKNYESPDCTFIFEKQVGENIYAIRNAKNASYLDCTITTMASRVEGDCQRWELIVRNEAAHEYYIRNCKNGKYMTKRASQLSGGKGYDEIYIIKSVE